MRLRRYHVYQLGYVVLMWLLISHLLLDVGPTQVFHVYLDQLAVGYKGQSRLQVLETTEASEEKTLQNLV